MNNAMIEQLIAKYHVKTLSNEGQLITLTDEMSKRLNHGIHQLGFWKNLDHRQPAIVYRGLSKQHLEGVLANAGTSDSYEKLLSKLFFFGDKSRNSLYPETEAGSHSWLVNHEDCSELTVSKIFERIHNLLTQRNNSDFLGFCLENNSFCEFFRNITNQSIFTHNVCRLGARARDYYLYLLHSHDKDNCIHSLLVSTSSSFDVAWEYAAGGNGKLVVAYVIPSPTELHAISAHSHSASEDILRGQGLPVYNCTSLYPDDHEYAVRGALFASHMIGVFAIDLGIFCANPHIFTEANRSTTFADGLCIEQGSFEARLSETRYRRGVSTFFEGDFRTIVGQADESSP